MNWLQSLCETYEKCAKHYLGNTSESKARPLLPICHITVQAHIEVVLDDSGNFRRAALVNKNDAITIIPATEPSASRSGKKPECHPLCDKLQYLAGDFVQYGGVVTSGFRDKPEEPYENFVNLLSDWFSHNHHPKLASILCYVMKRRLIEDLVAANILLLDSSGKLCKKQDIDRNQLSKSIFGIVNDQNNAVVRWIVEIPGDPVSQVWKDKTLWDAWIEYYLSRLSSNKNICLITGEERIMASSHPKYIRREGDNAKLISSNDTSGFTFRGRFIQDSEACSVSLEASHKAHYALAWLISRQGYQDGDLAIVAWAIPGTKVTQPEVIQPTDDPFTALYGNTPTDKIPVDTAQDIAIRLSKKIAGYRKAIGNRTGVIVMAVDSATPGRLSVVYYRTLSESDFLNRIEHWHETCAWSHQYRPIVFVGAPAPADIAEAAYGSRLDDKLKKATIKRLLPCIVDGQPLPYDIVESVIRRASNPVGMSRNEWEKALSIACALYRKHLYEKERFSMALDETRRTRDYLYGRLLAIADVIEERALHKAEQNRPTNAMRYMQQFSQRPFRTWKQIHDLLVPYLMRLGSSAYYYKNLIASVEGLFTPEEFMSAKPLSGEYLLGFYCQRQKLQEKTANSMAEATDRDDSSI